MTELLNALGSCDLTDTSFWGLRTIMKAMQAYQDSPEYKAAIEADTKAGYELAMSFKPDVILTPGYEYGVFMSLGEALGIPVVRFDL